MPGLESVAEIGELCLHAATHINIVYVEHAFSLPAPSKHVAWHFHEQPNLQTPHWSDSFILQVLQQPLEERGKRGLWERRERDKRVSCRLRDAKSTLG